MAGCTRQEACARLEGAKPGSRCNITRGGEGAAVAPWPRGPSSSLGQVRGLPGSPPSLLPGKDAPLLTPQLTVLGLSPAGWCPQRGGAPSEPGTHGCTRRFLGPGPVLRLCPPGSARRTGLRPQHRPQSCMSCPGWGGWTESLPSPPGLRLARVQLPAGPGMWVSLPTPLPILFSPPFLPRGGPAWDWGSRPGSFPMGALRRGAGAALLASLPNRPLAAATSLSLWPRVSHALRKELLSGPWPRGLPASERSQENRASPSPGPALRPLTPSICHSAIALAHRLEGLALCPALCWAVWEVLTPDCTDLSTQGSKAGAGHSVWS